MGNVSGKATAPQIETAVQIEQETARLRELAMKADLHFLVYLIDMAHDEASGLVASIRNKAGTT